jgi:hypothetical protein
MIPTSSWAAAAVLTGALAAGVPSTAAGDPTTPGPTAADITHCLVQNGLPPLGPGSVLLPAASPTPAGALPSGTLPSAGLPSSTLPSGTLPSGTLPTATLPAATLPAGTLPSGALPAGTLPAGTLPAGTLPAGALPAGTTPVGGGAAGTGLQCGETIINNAVYLVTLTVTTTTTSVDAPITAAAGSISTTSNVPGAAPAAAAPAAALTGASAIGRPLQAHGTTGARRSRAAKVKHRLVRVRLVAKRRHAAGR